MSPTTGGGRLVYGDPRPEPHAAAEIVKLRGSTPGTGRYRIRATGRADGFLADTKGKPRVPSGNVEKLFVETAVPTGPIDQVHFEDPVTYVAGAVFSPHWMC